MYMGQLVSKDACDLSCEEDLVDKKANFDGKGS